ncbi:MAG: transposase [Chloroflexota bacterium]
MNIRRYYIPNAIVFITQVVDRRMPIFNNESYMALLLQTLRDVKEIHPFNMVGYGFMPEHFHIMINPTGSSNFSKVMQSLKRNFTLNYKELIGITAPMKFWQKGFWDHVIRDDIDFERHLDYIHYNPVKHGLVTRPEEWPYSSFRHWRAKNMYIDHWGWSLPDTIQHHDWIPAEDDNLE